MKDKKLEYIYERNLRIIGDKNTLSDSEYYMIDFKLEKDEEIIKNIKESNKNVDYIIEFKENEYSNLFYNLEKNYDLKNNKEYYIIFLIDKGNKKYRFRSVLYKRFDNMSFIISGRNILIKEYNKLDKIYTLILELGDFIDDNKNNLISLYLEKKYNEYNLEYIENQYNKQGSIHLNIVYDVINDFYNDFFTKKK